MPVQYAALGGAPPRPEELWRDGNRISLGRRDRDAIATGGLAAERVAGDDHAVPAQDCAKDLHRVLGPPQGTRSQPLRTSRECRSPSDSPVAYGQSDEGGLQPVLIHSWSLLAARSRPGSPTSCVPSVPARPWHVASSRRSHEAPPRKSARPRAEELQRESKPRLEPCVLGHCPIDPLSSQGPNAPGFRAGGRELELSRGVAVLLGQAVLPLSVRALDRVAHEQRTFAVGSNPQLQAAIESNLVGLSLGSIGFDRAHPPVWPSTWGYRARSP